MCIPSGKNIKKSYKYDGQLLYNIKTSILKLDFFKYSNPILKTNETIQRIDDSYYLWARVKTGEMKLIKVPVTEILSFCIDACYNETSFSKLVSLIQEEFDLQNNDLYTYIINLCNKGILIDNVTPETVGSDNLKRLEIVFNESNYSIIKSLRNNLDILSQNYSLCRA